MEKAYKGGYGNASRSREWSLPLRAYDWKGLVAADRYYAIVFDHDFAKAFWGEKRYEHVGCGGILNVLKEIKCPKCGHVEPPLKEHDGWQYHLQQMVLEDDPLKYLEKFLDTK